MAKNPRNTHAIVQYGLCYRDRFGTEKNSQGAAEEFRRAANLDNKTAQLLLGLCYRAGEGVEKSDATAMEIFRQVA